MKKLNLEPVGTSSSKSSDGIVKLNFLDKNTYKDALKNVDGVFLMRPPQMGDPKLFNSFIDEMVKSKIKFVVFLSLLGVEGLKQAPHYSIENYIKDKKIPYCFIRPGFFMQNLSGTHAIEIIEYNDLYVAAGKRTFHFIDTEDIGEVTAKIFSDYENHIDKCYNIAGGKYKFEECAEIFTKELNRKITYSEPNLVKFLYYLYWTRKFPLGQAIVMGFVYGMEITTDQCDFEKLIGRKPKTLELFVKENVKIWEKK